MIIVVGISYLAFSKLSLLSVPKLEKLITNKIGYNITIAKIKSKWSGANLVMRIESITLQDKVTALPVLQAEYIESKLNVWEIISNIAIKNSLYFNIENLQYYNTKIFPEPIQAAAAHGRIAWQMQGDKISFDLKNFETVLPEVKIKANVSASYQDGNFSEVIFNVTTDALSVFAANKYIPIGILPQDLVEWLHSAIRGGIILSNSIAFNADKFDWIMNFKEVNLAYAPDWPALLDLAGTLHLTEQQITITGNSGKILNIPIETITASVDGLNRTESFPLIINGKVNATLQQGLQFLLASPLQHIGKILDNYKPAGKVKLDLDLSIPLIDTAKTAINSGGKLTVSDGVVVEPQFGTKINNIAGVINFTENKIMAEQLHTKFLDQNAVASINYDDKKSQLLEIALKTKLTAEALVDLCPILSGANMTGSTKFEVKMGVPMVARVLKKIVINSDLVGLGVDLPSPLGKDKKATKPIYLQLEGNDVLNINMSYGDKVNGKIAIKNKELKYGEIKLAGDEIVGLITKASDAAPLTAKFKKMVIKSSSAIEKKPQILTPSNLPLVLVTCDNLILAANSVGAVNFELQPKSYGYKIAKLNIANDDFKLQATGKWNMLGHATTTLSGNIISEDFGKVFSAWNIGSSIKKGTGELLFTIAWNGAPRDFKLLDLVGEVNLNINAGQIQGVNPGFGRVIGLLSLDNIQRRLKLDFSDLLAEGFSFDKLQAQFNINQGDLHTKAVFIDGPAAYIALVGEANIKTKQIDFKMGVVPKVGASLPLAAMITAGNPAIGAAFWILNKATGAKASDVPRYRYKVTGTWEKPEINEMAM